MLHITDGESVAGTLRESGIPGEVSVYGDLMYEGPAPAGLDADAWLGTRASWVAGPGGVRPTLEEARQYLRACEDTLAGFSRHEEVVIWVDDRLSDQLILIKVLDWFSRQSLRGTKLSLICVGRYAGVDHFVGLGQLNPNQLMSLADTRLAIGEEQYRTAQTAWNAFTSSDPRGIERFIESDTSALPFIATALRRHLEQSRRSIMACPVPSGKLFPSLGTMIHSQGHGSSLQCSVWRSKSSRGTSRLTGLWPRWPTLGIRSSKYPILPNTISETSGSRKPDEESCRVRQIILP